MGTSLDQSKQIEKSLKQFAAAVTEKSTQVVSGDPEDQLRGPFEGFLVAVGDILGRKVVCTGEARLHDRLGRPDYAVHVNGVLTGYSELKSPGTGAHANTFKGHNRNQFKRFSAIPNILYTDGSQWALYRGGELAGEVARLSGDVTTEGSKAVAGRDAERLKKLLHEFFSWEPFIPQDKSGRINLQEFADSIAPLCRMLRDDVTEALKHQDSPLVQLANDWRQLLFPDAPDEQFADAYAQTVTFALLLGRSEGANPLTLHTAEIALEAQHSLLSRALQVLTDAEAQSQIKASLDLLLRVIAAVPIAALTGTEDPWIYFYETFLAKYDPDLRKNAGAYYTPIEVVRAQVTLVDDILTVRLRRPLGFADPGVVTLDPAAGTGTYLLGVIAHALKKVEQQQGPGAVPGQASVLSRNLHGFEILVGPYAVAELRVTNSLRSYGAVFSSSGSHVYLTDTLESPHAQPLQLPMFLKPIADQHLRALKVKSRVPVIVCLGNPPYDRHEAATGSNQAQTGGWVRWGDLGDGAGSILQDFIVPAINSGHGVHIKNLYNLYVYFWRWALWKVFEHETAAGPGVVSFISASSYLDGDAFSGMREHMRKHCDEIWILDLGGEGRGAKGGENVFAIKTPVAIAIAFREKKRRKLRPATVYYTRLEGSRSSLLNTLGSIRGLGSMPWQECPTEWQSPFRPQGIGPYFQWPLLTDIFPWQHTGCEIKRTWPICHDQETLQRRWRALLESKDRASAFKETRDRTVEGTYAPLITGSSRNTPISSLHSSADVPPIVRYAFRSFDRQWILFDSRVGDYFRPDLLRADGPRQVYLASSVVLKLGHGPAVSCSSHLPDRHYFAGRGGKDIIPLYRSRDLRDSNLRPLLLDMLEQEYERPVSADDLLAYIYGILGHPGFVTLYSGELRSRELRVPITKDSILFEEVRGIGAKLIWLHTFAERFIPDGETAGLIPAQSARCEKAIPSSDYPREFSYSAEERRLYVGGGVFGPVSSSVFEFEISGLRVVQSWLKYRMKDGAGRKSSILDDIRPASWTSTFTTELLELLWVLEATVLVYPKLSHLLTEVVSGACFRARDFPGVPAWMRKPPRPDSGNFDAFR